jgi:methionine-S-sulfoxide reductase
MVETATFGGGCFWCIESAFKQLEGVESAVSGYAGGHTDNPSYRAVCSGSTGHAEVVRITYDPDVIGYNELLEIFFMSTTPRS